jgi:hypothetical protein
MDRCAEIPLFKPMLIATAPFRHRSSVSQHYGAGVRLNILSRIHRHQHHILARLLMKILTATQWPLMSILSAYTVAAKRRPSEQLGFWHHAQQTSRWHCVSGERSYMIIQRQLTAC